MDLVRLLLYYGASLDVKNRMNFRPIDYARVRKCVSDGKIQKEVCTWENVIVCWDFEQVFLL